MKLVGEIEVPDLNPALLDMEIFRFVSLDIPYCTIFLSWKERIIFTLILLLLWKLIGHMLSWQHMLGYEQYLRDVAESYALQEIVELKQS